MFNFLKDHFSAASSTVETVASKPATSKKKAARKKIKYPASTRRWSECEKDAVKILRAEGKAWKEIAEYVGHTVGSTEQTFYCLRKKDGQRKSSTKDTWHRRILAAVETGANTQQGIAEGTGIHPADVSNTLPDLIKSGRIAQNGYVTGPFGRPPQKI